MTMEDWQIVILILAVCITGGFVMTYGTMRWG